MTVLRPLLVLLALLLAGCTAPETPSPGLDPGKGTTPTGPSPEGNPSNGTDRQGTPPSGQPTAVRCRGDHPDANFTLEPSTPQRAPVPRWCPGDAWTWRVTGDGPEGRATWTVKGIVDVNGTRAYEVLVDEPGRANHTVYLDVANLSEVWDVCAEGRPLFGQCRGRVPRFDFPLTQDKAWTYSCCGGDVVTTHTTRATFAGLVDLPTLQGERVPGWRLVETWEGCANCSWTYVHATHWGPFIEKWFTGPEGQRGQHWVLVQGVEERIPADCEALDRSDEWWNATVRGPPGARVRLPLVRNAAGTFAAAGAAGDAVTVEGTGNDTRAVVTVGPNGTASASLHRTTRSAATTGCVAETYLDGRWTGSEEARPSELQGNATAAVQVVMTYQAGSNYCGRHARFEGNATEPGGFLLQGRDEAICS